MENVVLIQSSELIPCPYDQVLNQLGAILCIEGAFFLNPLKLNDPNVVARVDYLAEQEDLMEEHLEDTVYEYNADLVACGVFELLPGGQCKLKPGMEKAFNAYLASGYYERVAGSEVVYAQAGTFKPEHPKTRRGR